MRYPAAPHADSQAEFLKDVLHTHRNPLPLLIHAWVFAHAS
jgi:hypothetical protein